MQTPWGASDYQEKLAEGMWWVGTPGHGGLMIGKAEARRKLTPEAQACGRPFGNWLCYEEDCDYAVPFYELQELREAWNRLAVKARQQQEIQASALDVLRCYHGAYLMARGLAAVEELPRWVESLAGWRNSTVEAEVAHLRARARQFGTPAAAPVAPTALVLVLDLG